MANFKYLLKQLYHRLDQNKCPSGGSLNASAVDNKFFVTVLLQCNNCLLRYRFPSDPPEMNDKFYQGSYRQAGLTTVLPDTNGLQKLLDCNFSDSGKDFSTYYPLLNCISEYLNKKLTILDYGANWGVQLLSI